MKPPPPFRYAIANGSGKKSCLRFSDKKTLENYLYDELTDIPLWSHVSLWGCAENKTESIINNASANSKDFHVVVMVINVHKCRIIFVLVCFAY
jgi:hypothetical protein